MNAVTGRFATIDWLRAFAIILMIIYHFCYDLRIFNIITEATFTHPVTTLIGRLCLSSFLFCVGYSLAISHSQGINWPAFWKRWLKIAAAAALVSFASWVAYPQYWIFFGILHHICVASILGLAFLRIPMIALTLGTLMMAYWVLVYFLIHYFQVAPVKLIPEDPLRFRGSLDFISLFPWSGAMLMGIGAHKLKLHQHIQLPNNHTATFLSKHSLLIYLAHQPILYGSVWLYTQLF